MRVAILSPHRDDAAFSCGLVMLALLQAGASLTVVNVYTHSDYAVDLTTVEGGLPTADAISRTRRKEDEHFVADLLEASGREPGAVRLVDLGFHDAPLRLSVVTERVLESPLTTDEVAEQAEVLAASLAATGPFDLVFAPLAMGDHIDHRIAREAARMWVAPEQLCFYEDLPYAGRVAPQERKAAVLDAVAPNRAEQCGCYGMHLVSGAHLKRRFAMHYPSQIAAEVADEMAAYAGQWSRDGGGTERWWSTAAAGGLMIDLLQNAATRCRVTREQE